MPNEESVNTGKIKTVCNYCGSELHPDAKVCPACGHYKRKMLNWIRHLASATALVMVILAIVQLILAYGEKVDTNKMLNEVEIVKNKADATLTTVEEREKQLSVRLSEVSSDIDSLAKAFESNKQELASNFANLSSEIDKTKDSADKQVNQIVNSVNLQASKSKKRLKKMETDFNTKQDKLNLELATLKDELTVQLEKLQWRDNLIQLTDNAISKCDRYAYDKLKRLETDFKGSDKGSIIVSYILRVKRMYIGLKRYPDEVYKKDGKIVTMHDLSTNAILTELLNNPANHVRALAARALINRQVKGVPEALIKTMQNDRDLYVIKNCINSFCILTGCKQLDVLDYGFIIDYWDKNKLDVVSKLSNPT